MKINVIIVLLVTTANASWILTNKTNLENGVEFLLNEGVSNDGSYLYLTGHKSIIKTRLDNVNDIVQMNLYPIPQQYSYCCGYNHVGDIAVVDDMIYAPIENTAYHNASIFVYSADTLEFVNSGFTSQRHFPWLAYYKNQLYSSEFSNVSEIFVYNMDEGFTLASILKLAQPLQSVQGGDFLDGFLYVSLNPPNPAVVRIDIYSGSVTTVIDTPIEPEAEGLTFVTTNNNDVQLVVMNGHTVVPGQYSTLFVYTQQ